VVRPVELVEKGNS